jgi:hypothetical protein
MVIQKTFPETSLDIVYLGLSFVQKWKLLMKLLKKLKVEELMATVLKKAKDFKPLASFPCDVGVI